MSTVQRFRCVLVEQWNDGKHYVYAEMHPHDDGIWLRAADAEADKAAAVQQTIIDAIEGAVAAQRIAVAEARVEGYEQAKRIYLAATDATVKWVQDEERARIRAGVEAHLTMLDADGWKASLNGVGWSDMAGFGPGIARLIDAAPQDGGAA